jgi:predicted O-methyltransferase YrrM
MKDIAPTISPQPVTRAAFDAYVGSPLFWDLVKVFGRYPERSLMSSQSRAVLYWLARTMRPEAVAEIGTLFAGTTEVLARALWENGHGVAHTADPFGAERCPQAIAQWPADLQQHVRFYPLNSMAFFAEMREPLDLVLVDGNHDSEYALFDLQMAARLVRPGGIIVMDNSEQTGPFKAARAFVAANPGWQELGDALATYDPLQPFDRTRASVKGTSFLILQAPERLILGEGPHSWGQSRVEIPRVDGLAFDVGAPAAGTLCYQVFLRGFASDSSWIEELRADGSVRIDGNSMMEHAITPALSIDGVPFEAVFTLEIDLSWQGKAPLVLAGHPRAICKRHHVLPIARQ